MILNLLVILWSHYRIIETPFVSFMGFSVISNSNTWLTNNVSLHCTDYLQKFH